MIAQLAGIALVWHPELALERRIAAVILFEDMKGGIFTRVGLPRYVNDTTDDPVNARLITGPTTRTTSRKFTPASSPAFRRRMTWMS